MTIGLIVTILWTVFAGLPDRAQALQGLPTLPTNDLQGLLALTGAQTPAPAPTQTNAEPPLAAVPPAVCDSASHPLAGEQGRVPAAAINSPAAAQGWTCNASVVSHYGSPGGFRVWRYVDQTGHACAYYDTSLFSPLNVASLAGGPSTGVVVLDMSDPANPVQTGTLTSLAMLAPHESLNLNHRRGLLAAEMGNGATLPGLMSIYDVSQDCRHPALDSTYLAASFGHESGFTADGNTFWIGGAEGIAAVDVSDPKNPQTIWRGNEFSHGLNLSDNGNTLYATNPIDGGLTLLNVSQIQARQPQPTVSEISRLTWNTVSIPQNTNPMTIDGRPYLLEFDEFAFRFNPATINDTVGAARIIDISDPAHPHVTSNIRLAVNMPAAHQAANGDPFPLPSQPLGYSAHYCAIPREVDPEIVACSFLNSGLRIFNIQDPLHPREIAYYISPPSAASNPGATAADFAFAQPAFDPARRAVWYSDATTGFYNLQLDPGVWPHPTSVPSPSDNTAAAPPTVCTAATRLTFRLRRVPHGRIVRVAAFVNGRRVLRRSGRNLKHISFARSPGRLLAVKIITRDSHGARVVTMRTFQGCTRTKVVGKRHDPKRARRHTRARQRYAHTGRSASTHSDG
ncbi:MAG: LVIVD repeat-containing protein [Solirubrobacteraceae bacterium]